MVKCRCRPTNLTILFYYYVCQWFVPYDDNIIFTYVLIMIIMILSTCDNKLKSYGPKMCCTHTHARHTHTKNKINR